MTWCVVDGKVSAKMNTRYSMNLERVRNYYSDKSICWIDVHVTE